MLPAFRSTKSLVAFCALLIFILTLPITLSMIGLPPREEAWSGISIYRGAAGDVVRTIYDDHDDVDVLLLGPSLLRRGLSPEAVQEALTKHLGRPAHVALLSLTGSGSDLPYFLLRDYLTYHQPKVIIWNEPEPGSYFNEPHIQAYRWMRYGEFGDLFTDLPLFFRLQVYGDMVLGAPKELLYKLRPNLLSEQEKADRLGQDVEDHINSGYFGAPFVPDALPGENHPIAKVMSVSSPIIHSGGRPLRSYQLKYLRSTAELAKEKNCPLILLHLPMDSEYGNTTLPEIANWSDVLGPGYQIIGLPASVMFEGMTKDRFLHFFTDKHLNANGRQMATSVFVPAIIEAYDESK